MEKDVDAGPIFSLYCNDSYPAFVGMGTDQKVPFPRPLHEHLIQETTYWFVVWRAIDYSCTEADFAVSDKYFCYDDY